MPKLLLHIGPGKCGSSSIQQFFANCASPCKEMLQYKLLDQGSIVDLDLPAPGYTAIENIANLLQTMFSGSDTVLLSHEVLFQNPRAIAQIVELAKPYTNDIRIIGYCRRQSEFIPSAYSQWLFRSPNRVKEDEKVVVASGVDPLLFTGLERHLIACIQNDFHSARQLSGRSILYWHENYQAIVDNLGRLEASVTCGTIPSRDSTLGLVEDFCLRSGLSLLEHALPGAQAIGNPSFNPDLVEALNSALLSGVEVPGPHTCNKELMIVSSRMHKFETTNEAFLATLKSYVDGFFRSSNRSLCEKFSLERGMFEPDFNVSKGMALDCIHQEGEKRKNNPIEQIKQYRRLSGNLALCGLSLSKKIARQ